MKGKGWIILLALAVVAIGLMWRFQPLSPTMPLETARRGDGHF